MRLKIIDSAHKAQPLQWLRLFVSSDQGGCESVEGISEVDKLGFFKYLGVVRNRKEN